MVQATAPFHSLTASQITIQYALRSAWDVLPAVIGSTACLIIDAHKMGSHMAAHFVLSCMRVARTDEVLILAA